MGRRFFGEAIAVRDPRPSGRRQGVERRLIAARRQRVNPGQQFRSRLERGHHARARTATTAPAAPTASRGHPGRCPPEADLTDRSRFRGQCRPQAGSRTVRAWLTRGNSALTDRLDVGGVDVGGIAAEQGAIGRTPVHQLVMGPQIDHPARIHDGDSVSQGQRRTAVGNQNRRSIGGQSMQGRVNSRFSGRIDRAGCVIQDQHPRVGDHGPRQSQPLPLSTGKGEPALPDDRVEPLRKGVDEFGRLGQRGRGLDLGSGRVGPAVTDVVGDRVGEQERFLEHHPDCAAQIGQGSVPDVDTADPDAAGLRIVEARKQQGDRRFTGSRGADQSDGGAGRHGEVEAVEHGFIGRVTEPDVPELDLRGSTRQPGRPLRVADGRA